MTGPQFREPREPPDGPIGHGPVLACLICGAVGAAAVFLLLAFGFPPRA